MLVASTLCFGLGALLWYYPIRSRAGDTQTGSVSRFSNRASLETMLPTAPPIVVEEQPPLHAPPFPGNVAAEASMSMASASVGPALVHERTSGLQIGAAVRLNGQGPTGALTGQKGVVTSS